jgi:hypothetical protein
MDTFEAPPRFVDKGELAHPQHALSARAEQIRNIEQPIAKSIRRGQYPADGVFKLQLADGDLDENDFRVTRTVRLSISCWPFDEASRRLLLLFGVFVRFDGQFPLDFLGHQIGANEGINVAVQNAVHVAHFKFGTVIFDHAVRLHNV